MFGQGERLQGVRPDAASGRSIKRRGRVRAKEVFPKGRRLCTALMIGTVVGGFGAPAMAQSIPAGAPAQNAPAQAPAGQAAPEAPPALPGTSVAPEPTRNVASVTVQGNQRLEAETVLSYTSLRIGQPYDQERLDQALRDLYATELFADVVIAGAEPQIVQLDQNRVDVVFEINEGPRSRVRRINIIGNEEFGDHRLIQEMATREHVWYNIFSSRDTYDPDRLAYDQQKLRQFYLTQGYADFRVVSAVAELTPDGRDFIITYVVEEGDRYKFGDLSVER